MSDQDAPPTLPPRPGIPKRNPNAKILPPTPEKVTSPTAMVKPTVIETPLPTGDRNEVNEFAGW